MATMQDVLDGIERVGTNQAQIKRRLEALEIGEARKSIVMPGGSYFASEQRPETKAFLKYLKHGEKRLTSDEQKALVLDNVGQYLVPSDVEQEVFRGLAAPGTIRSLASVRTTSRDRIQVRTLSGLSVGWGRLETGAPITESTLTPTEESVYIEDLYALTKCGEDELADADADLPSIVVEEFRKALDTAENLAFIAGAGHGSNQPSGITTNTTLLADAVETAGPNAILIDDMLGAIYTVPTQYRKGLSIIVHSQTELALRELKAAVTGTYLWQPSVIENTPNRFAGWPIYTDDSLATLGGVAGILAVVGNIREGFRIYDRLGLTVQYIDQLYAEAGLVAWRLHMRVGSYVVRPADKRIVLLREHA